MSFCAAIPKLSIVNKQKKTENYITGNAYKVSSVWDFNGKYFYADCGILKNVSVTWLFHSTLCLLIFGCCAFHTNQIVFRIAQCINMFCYLGP